VGYPKLTPNYEVDDVVWVPLHFLIDHRNREPLEWEWKGQKMATDSYLYDTYRIWGLSLMMIDDYRLSGSEVGTLPSVSSFGSQFS